MKIILKAGIFLLLPFAGIAQNVKSIKDSLYSGLKYAGNDTARMDIYNSLGFFYEGVSNDSSIQYREKALILAKKLKLNIPEANILTGLASEYAEKGEYSRAFILILEALRILENPACKETAWHLSDQQSYLGNRLGTLSMAYYSMSLLYDLTGNIEKEFEYIQKARNTALIAGDTVSLAWTNFSLGEVYSKTGRLDSALILENLALPVIETQSREADRKYAGNILMLIGEIYYEQMKTEEAYRFFLAAIQKCRELNNLSALANTYTDMAGFYYDANHTDSALWYTDNALRIYSGMNDKRGMALTYNFIASVYERQNKKDSVIKYIKAALETGDSLNTVENERLIDFQNLNLEVMEKQQQLIKERAEVRNKTRVYLLLGGLAAVLITSLMLYRNNRLKKYANIVLQSEKDKAEEINRALLLANREMQFETALEKVLSRTTSMRKSSELNEVSVMLFQVLKDIGVPAEQFTIGVFKEEEGVVEISATRNDAVFPDTYKVSLDEPIVNRRLVKAWKSGEKSVIIDINGEELKQYIQFRQQLDILNKVTPVETLGPRWVIHAAFYSKGAVSLASHEMGPGGAVHMLEKIAAVFDIAYTRFLDLTAQEAYAKQARRDLQQIEAEMKKKEEALSELQAAQKQLIQSEKMASLGELTAGIAHEIQNPLNFVNNFSDVSTELVDEMNEEIDKGNLEDARQIAQDLKQNLEKINHHGKRAGDIVKGMLQHSRSSSGVKEPTDINALADEYLRLAYHGLRAKDKTFNAAMKTDYDEGIGLIKIIPQDIGRVVLNLITNAFYAVTERKKLSVEGYEPIVTVTTKKFSDRVEVHVKDNGTGIPQKVLDKIFQPFYTTKPTGQGTGLGLSLSYDIVKAHGGELKVVTKEGEGSEFVVMLPI